MKLPLYIFITIALVAPIESHAYRVYRCSGRVQFRPCEVPTKKTAAQSQLPISTSQPEVMPPNTEEASSSPLFAKLERSSFSKITGSDGLWKGSIRGNGRIHLVLRILDEGGVKSSIYMGSIFLHHKSTGFNFRSSLPREKNWTWRIDVSSTAS